MDIRKLLEQADIASLDLIQERDERDIPIAHWFVLSLEPKEDAFVQTVQFTITWDEQWEHLIQFLLLNDMMHQPLKYDITVQGLIQRGNTRTPFEIDPLVQRRLH